MTEAAQATPTAPDTAPRASHSMPSQPQPQQTVPAQMAPVQAQQQPYIGQVVTPNEVQSFMPLQQEDQMNVMPQYQQQGSQYQQAYMVQMPIEPAAHPGRIQAIIGIVMGILAVVTIPIIFGPAGITLGMMAQKKGAGGVATAAIIVATMGMVAGMILRALASIQHQGLEGMAQAMILGM